MEKKCENCAQKQSINNIDCVNCRYEGKYSAFIPKKMTNRQWMGSLSDEELARKSFYIFNTTLIDGVPYPVYVSSLPNSNKGLYPNKEKVIEENINWLRAEHKVSSYE